ncbi:MAG: HIT domain-containing protein [Elusimicrobiales bacterium]|nr:HIT domain-containing protein [Elusimicrobiales bacterium]
MDKKKGCIFCTRENVAVLWEDKNFYVAANIKSIIFGHLLIIPKKHVAEIGMLKGALKAQMHDIALSIARLFRDKRKTTEFYIFDLSVDDKRRSIKDHAHLHFHPSSKGAIYQPAKERPLISDEDVGKLKELFEGFEVNYF